MTINMELHEARVLLLEMGVPEFLATSWADKEHIYIKLIRCFHERGYKWSAEKQELSLF